MKLCEIIKARRDGKGSRDRLPPRGAMLKVAVVGTERRSQDDKISRESIAVANRLIFSWHKYSIKATPGKDGDRRGRAWVVYL